MNPQNQTLQPEQPLPQTQTTQPTPAVPVSSPTPTDDAMKYIIPIGRSGYAIAAGYLGLCAILVIPAPLAILFGVLALNDIKKNPKKIGKGRAWFGIISGGLVCAFIVFLIIVSAFTADTPK